MTHPMFSTINDIIDIVYSIDPVYEKSHWSDLYWIWYYGRELIPGHPNHEYLVGTGQLYLIPTFIKSHKFRELLSWCPGMRDLYKIALNNIN